MLTSHRSSLTRGRALAFLDGLKGEAGPAWTLYLPRGVSPEETDELLREAGVPVGVPEVAELAAGSATGAAVFWGRSLKCLFMPPFPLGEKLIEPGLRVSPLSDLLGRTLKIALVLVRLRAYAVGLCRDETLIASKVGAGNIHARHRQGGSSQARFARHREKQIESFLTRVCGHAQDILGPEAGSVDYIAYGGSREAILLLREQCAFLRRFDDRRLPPMLDLEEPRQRVLERAAVRVWSSTVVEWREDGELEVGI